MGGNNLLIGISCKCLTELIEYIWDRVTDRLTDWLIKVIA